MFRDPVTLINETIAHLHGCAELLADEFDPAIHKELTREGRVCRETHIAIQALLPLLREARATQASDESPMRRVQCIGCEE